MSDQLPPPGPGGVSWHVSDRVGHLTIDRPSARNAIGFQTMAELETLILVARDSEADVIVLRGAGDRVFVSGGDLRELARLRTHEEAATMARRMRAVLDGLARVPAVVVAVLNGHAYGGGAELALAADLRVAASDVRIAFNQVDLAIMPAWGGVERLTELVGRSHAMDLLLTGRHMDMTECLHLGLVDRVFEREQLDRKTTSLVRGIAELEPGVARAIKEAAALVRPNVHEDLAQEAVDKFARLWAAESHWAAAAAQAQRLIARRTS